MFLNILSFIYIRFQQLDPTIYLGNNNSLNNIKLSLFKLYINHIEKYLNPLIKELKS
jgi:hypothetical protein